MCPCRFFWNPFFLPPPMSSLFFLSCLTPNLAINLDHNADKKGSGICSCLLSCEMNGLSFGWGLFVLVLAVFLDNTIGKFCVFFASFSIARLIWVFLENISQTKWRFFEDHKIIFLGLLRSIYFIKIFYFEDFSI